jgi:DNA-binding response OmpR family regulator
MTTALIVEDEAIIALDLAAELQSLGFDVLRAARTYDQAVAIADRKRPDLAIVDLVLNGSAEGRQLVEELRARGIRVLVVTGSADPLPVGDGQASLTKPWHRKDLIRAIGTLTALAA